MDKLAQQFENELKGKMLRAKKNANIIRPDLIKCLHNMEAWKLLIV